MLLRWSHTSTPTTHADISEEIAPPANASRRRCVGIALDELLLSSEAQVRAKAPAGWSGTLNSLRCK